MKKARIFMVAALSLSMLGGCGEKGASMDKGADASAENGGEMTIKLASVGPETGTTQAEGEMKFKEYVEEASGGKIKVERYCNSALGGDAEMLSGCSMGTIEMCNPSISVLTTYDERFGILDMPFLFDDYEAELKAVNEGRLGEEFENMLAGTGIKLGKTYYFGGYRGLSNSVRPVETVEDMKGLKIRVMESPVYITAFEMMGANPTPMSFSELFTGLQNKTVDGQDNDPSLTYTSQYYEVQDYYSNLEHTISIGCIAMSDEWYSGLSEEEQKIIDEGIKVQSEYVTEASLKNYEGYMEDLEEAGMQVTRISDENRKGFKEAVEPMYEQYKEELGEDIFDMAQEFNE